MKYLKKFNTETQYDTFRNSEQWTTPNVSIIVENRSSRITKRVPPPSLCDIAYWDGKSVKTVAKDKWDTSLGTPVGVVVIPGGMLPDGKARVVSLKYPDNNGNATTSPSSKQWGPSGTDTSLTYYDRFPTTDNSGSTSTGSASSAFLPSDQFTGVQSFVDPKAKYYSSSNTPFIPSPYLGNDKTLNPEYCKEISGYNNALSDFNGLTNTQTLVGLGTDYVAANAAWKYSDGVSNSQWYLPAMGELGFLLPRFNEINEAIRMVGGTILSSSGKFWSSSEFSSYVAFDLSPYGGNVYCSNKTYNGIVRPFICI